MADSIDLIDCKCKRNNKRRSETSFLCAYQLGIKTGQRIVHRRTALKSDAYVDLYSGHLMLCVVSIIILSSFDAFFTLNILAAGGEELNAFMAVLIADNVVTFVSVKLGLTSLALILLTIHHNVQLTEKIQVRHFVYLILTGYTVLIGYEISLLSLAEAWSGIFIN